MFDTTASARRHSYSVGVQRLCVTSHDASVVSLPLQLCHQWMWINLPAVGIRLYRLDTLNRANVALWRLQYDEYGYVAVNAECNGCQPGM